MSPKDRTLILTERAARLARIAHRGQVDKVGEDYIAHPRRVAAAVTEAVGNGEAVQVAWLHDVVEDTDVTLYELGVFGSSTQVIAAVDALTKRKGESFEDYYERVKADNLAVVVKWFDVADNADPRRLAKVAPDTQDRLREKYERAKAVLSDVR